MLRRHYQRACQILRAASPALYGILFRYRMVFKYLFAGGTAVIADTGALYLSKGVFGFSLIPSVAIGFLVGFCVSFILQKFWTFGDLSVDTVHIQATLYFIVAAANFFVTELLMYFLVEVIHVWYILAKICVALGIAICTFFIYRIYIFKQSTRQ